MLWCSVWLWCRIRRRAAIVIVSRIYRESPPNKNNFHYKCPEFKCSIFSVHRPAIPWLSSFVLVRSCPPSLHHCYYVCLSKLVKGPPNGRPASPPPFQSIIMMMASWPPQQQQKESRFNRKVLWWRAGGGGGKPCTGQRIEIIMPLKNMKRSRAHFMGMQFLQRKACNVSIS